MGGLPTGFAGQFDRGGGSGAELEEGQVGWARGGRPVPLRDPARAGRVVARFRLGFLRRNEGFAEAAFEQGAVRAEVTATDANVIGADRRVRHQEHHLLRFVDHHSLDARLYAALGNQEDALVD